MKKLLKEFRNQSVWHYIIAFSAIVTGIIVILGGYLYSFYYRTIYNDFLSSNKIYLSSISERHENNMQVLNDISLQMGLSNDIVAFRLERQPEKSMKLKERLYQYTTVNQFINEIFYVYRNDSYIYDYLTSADAERFFEKGFTLSGTEEEELRRLFYQNGYRMTALAEQEVDGYLTGSFVYQSKNVVVYICPVTPGYYGNMVFVVDSANYDELLECGNEELRENYVIYDGQVLVERGSLELDSKELIGELEEAQSFQKKVSLGGKKYLMSAAKGESGIVYCSVQSLDIFSDKILTQQWGILFLLLLCSIPASMAIVLLARTLTTRIKNINILLNDDEEAYYNLDDIENGIRTLVESSREAAKESTPLRRTKFLISFIRNEYADRESMKNAARRAELCVDYRFFVVVLMGDRGNSNERKAHEKMLEEVSAAKGIDGYGMSLMNQNQSLFVLFGDEKELLNEVGEMIFEIGKKYCEEFIMAVSGFHECYGEASQAYLEADAAFDNRFLMDNNEIIRYGNLAKASHVDLLPETYLRRLKNAIRTGEEAEADRVVQEICARLKKENYSLLTFRLLYNDIIHMLVTEWNISDSDSRNIYSVFTLSQCLTMQDFNDVLCEFCHMLISGRRAVENDTTDLVNHAVAYMKENFRNADLNMGALADYLQVSPVTLAVEFKNGMGMNPSDYLALIRMEHAKELLRSTDMRIKEISLAVGYEDDHVFMRRFKKYVGKTPGQYRSEQ